MAENEVSGMEYEAKLRRHFKTLNPTPQWAEMARQKLHTASSKRRRPSQSSVEDEEVVQEIASLRNLTNSLGGLTDESVGRSKLPSGTLAIERLRDANQAAVSQGKIHSLQFHPSPSTPLLFTASSDRRLRLFNVSDSLASGMKQCELTIDRWTHQPSPANSARTIAPHNSCLFSSDRKFNPAHRTSSFLPHLRSSIWYHHSLSSASARFRPKLTQLI